MKLFVNSVLHFYAPREISSIEVLEVLLYLLAAVLFTDIKVSFIS